MNRVSGPEPVCLGPDEVVGGWRKIAISDHTICPSSWLAISHIGVRSGVRAGGVVARGSISHSCRCRPCEKLCRLADPGDDLNLAGPRRKGADLFESDHV